MAATLGVGIVGLGFMGRTHAAAFARARAAGLPCDVVAVCDHAVHAPACGRGNVATGEELSGPDWSRVRRYTQVDDLLADAGVDVVSICTYTDTHAPIAVRALAAGKHVLVEKPVAIRAADVREVSLAAQGAKGRICMPAMCIRFWPGWDWLHDRMRDGSLGALRSISLERLGSVPAWSDFYRDYARSGGPLFDLHIHDTDFVVWALGQPDSVSTHGHSDHFTTIYGYSRGPAHVSAQAAWDLSPSAGFRMRYLAAFENATAEFDLARTPRLMVHDAAGSRAVELPDWSGYDGEVRHLIEAIVAGVPPRATIPQAERVTLVLEAEKRSLDTGGKPQSLAASAPTEYPPRSST